MNKEELCCKYDTVYDTVSIVNKLPLRLCLNCCEIELNSPNVKLVLTPFELEEKLKRTDTIEINGFVFKKDA